MTQKINISLAILIAVIFAAVVVFLDGSAYIDSDGWGYYHSAKSLVKEGNFVTSEKPEYYQYASHRVVPSQGKFVSKYPPGYPMIAYPAMLAASLFDRGSTYSDYFKAYNGHSIWDGLALLLLNVLLTIISFIFIYKMLAIFEISPLARFFASGLPFLVSFYYTYALEEIGFSHPSEVFTLSGVLFFTFKTLGPKQSAATGLRFCALWSTFFGLAVLVRPTNAIILLPWLMFYIHELFHNYTKPLFLKSLASIGVIGSSLLAVYLYYNWVSCGNPLTVGYMALSSVRFSFNKIYLFPILISGCRGWFVYSPAVIFSILGLILLGFSFKSENDNYTRLQKNFSLFSLLSICLNVLTYSFWQGWWAGNSAGQRYFILLIPFLAIGFAGWWRYLRLRGRFLRISLISLLATFVVYSMTLTLLLRVSSVPVMARYIDIKRLHPEIPPTEEFTVLDVFKYHYTLIHTSGSLSEYLDKLMAGYKNGRSIITLFTNLSEPIVKIESLDKTRLRLHINPRPNGLPANSDIIMTIKSKKFSHRYLVSGISFAEYEQIQIQCDDTGCIFTGGNSAALRIKKLQLEAAFKDDFLKLSNGLLLSLTYIGDKINFPDFRLH